MKNMNPLVSIIIPVYNGSNYIKETIENALQQSYKNIEILVVNDGSTDSTEEIVKTFGTKVRYLKKENGGVASALNLAIQEMKGEYFSWLSHDDYYEKDKIKKEINYLKSKGLLHTKTIVFSDFSYIDENNNITCNVVVNFNNLKNNIRYALLRQLVNGLSLLIPKQAFIEHGYFDLSLRCTQDYAKWLDFIKTYKYIYINEFLVSTRIHLKSTSQTSPLLKEEDENLFLRMVKSFSRKEILELEGSEYEFYYKLIEYLNTRHYKKALDYCQNVIKNLEPQTIKSENVLIGGYHNKNIDSSLFKKITISIRGRGLLNTVKHGIKKAVGKK